MNGSIGRAVVQHHPDHLYRGDRTKGATMKDVFTRHLWPVIGLAAIGLLAPATPARGDDFGFEFNTNGVLPSAQGATYLTSGLSETSVFSASGGLLHQNTLGTGQYAIYEVPHTFNHHFDASITW